MRAAPPRRATKPTPGAANQLASISAIANLMNRRGPDAQRVPAPLLEHQRLIARVASERTKDGKRFRYPTVVLTMPRRSGKTVLVEAIMVQRALMYPGAGIYYTAQRASDAQAVWAELVETLQKSPSLAPFLDKPRRSKGSSYAPFKNGSLIAPFTPSADALDGKNTDLVVIDEAFSMDETKGNLLLASANPTMLNRPNGQLWIISTAGYSDSTFLKGWIDSAAAQLNTPGASFALFDWSMAPGGDPEDPNEWARFHPGLTTGLTTIEGLKDARARARTKEEWLRGYCNTWSINAAEPLLNLDNWQTLAAAAPLPADRSKIFYALDVAAGATRSSLAAAWIHNGAPHVSIVKDEAGTDWITPALTALGNPRLTVWATGPTRVIVDQLPREQQAKIRRVNGNEAGAAMQALITLADNSKITHSDSPALNAALEDAAPRKYGESIGLDTSKSRGPVCAIRAASLALQDCHKPARVLQVFA